MQPHDHSPLNDFIEYPEEHMLARSTDFLKAMQRRHSIRHFSDKPVDKAIIENCILTAGTAPSGANHQPWHFSAIHSASIKKSKFANKRKPTNGGFMMGALDSSG